MKRYTPSSVFYYLTCGEPRPTTFTFVLHQLVINGAQRVFVSYTSRSPRHTNVDEDINFMV